VHIIIIIHIQPSLETIRPLCPGPHLEEQPHAVAIPLLLVGAAEGAGLVAEGLAEVGRQALRVEPVVNAGDGAGDGSQQAIGWPSTPRVSDNYAIAAKPLCPHIQVG
jgi:hypothetical protein